MVLKEFRREIIFKFIWEKGYRVYLSSKFIFEEREREKERARIQSGP